MSQFSERTRPTRYQILSVSSNPADRVTIEVEWWHGVWSWAVLRRGFHLAMDGEWEMEPLRSDIDMDYWSRTHWRTAEEAFEAYVRLVETR